MWFLRPREILAQTRVGHLRVTTYESRVGSGYVLEVDLMHHLQHDHVLDTCPDSWKSDQLLQAVGFHHWACQGLAEQTGPIWEAVAEITVQREPEDLFEPHPLVSGKEKPRWSSVRIDGVEISGVSFDGFL